MDRATEWTTEFIRAEDAFPFQAATGTLGYLTGTVIGYARTTTVDGTPFAFQTPFSAALYKNRGDEWCRAELIKWAERELSDG